MNKLLSSLILIIILVACTAPNKEIPTETPEFVTLNPIPIRLVTEIPFIGVGDGGLISGQPCAAPCFFGIHIGETSLEQVIPTLKTYGLSPCEPFNERIIVCGSQVTIGVDASTSLVNGIEYDPSISISVGKFIEKYGDPNVIIVEYDITGTPEYPKLRVFLLWDAVKMIVELPEISDQDEHTYVVEETTEVRFINYADEMSYSSPPTSGLPQPWKGYGAYKP